jgi:hypothetical protein
VLSVIVNREELVMDGLSRWSSQRHASRRRGRVKNAIRVQLGIGPAGLSYPDLEREEELASLDHEIVGLVAELPAARRRAVLERVVASNCS